MGLKWTSYFFLVALFAVIVIAAATLQKEQKVLTCSDSDFDHGSGLTFTIAGNITGQNLNGSNYQHDDRCKPSDNVTLAEFACKVNATGTYKQVWSFNCSELNKTCVNGRCA